MFGIIFIYLLVTIITYMTKDRVAVYEVREGSILKDTSYSGIVLREESLVNAEHSGYVNYFLESGQKIAVGSKVYTLSTEKIQSEAVGEEEEENVELSTEEYNAIQQKAQSFNKSFQNNDFSAVSTLQQETAAIIQNKTTQNRVVQLNSIIKSESVEGLEVYKAADDGIIQLSVDGLEDMTMENLTLDIINKVNYSKTELTNNTQVSAGDAVYRLITEEDWTIVFQLDDEMKETFQEKMGEKDYLNLDVRFLKDNEVMRGALQIYEKNSTETYGYISFSNSMIRYAQERYLDIELILEDETGLKIPKSSVTEKEFYVIPMDYLTTGGSSTQTGVLKQTKDKNDNLITEFQAVDVFYQDEELGVVYVEPSAFESGDVLIMPESTQTTTLNEKDTLQGVYNVNKGYAVFKRVEILCESEEYYIIEEGSSYGLSNYDRIALDGSSVSEGQIVNQ